MVTVMGFVVVTVVVLTAVVVTVLVAVVVTVDVSVTVLTHVTGSVIGSGNPVALTGGLMPSNIAIVGATLMDLM